VWHPDQGKQVRIIAAAISVDDAKHIAVFSGNVRLTQGDVRLQCSLARAYYVPGARADQVEVTRIECEPPP
jgi:lipopolysaccharide export system protein LptA